jgi:hypothetical protein
MVVELETASKMNTGLQEYLRECANVYTYEYDPLHHLYCHCKKHVICSDPGIHFFSGNE